MSMLSVGSDSRRPGGVRACVLPLLVFFVFVVGYLIGSWSSPLSTNPAAHPPPLPAETRKARERQLLDRSPNLANASLVSPPAAGSSKETASQTSSIGPQKQVSPPGRASLEYEVVVSHYNEPLDWLKPCAEQAGHVYHKGSDRGPPFDMYKWERLPNVGREAHTYLYHILQNYDSLAEVTVFLQGHGSQPHITWCFADPAEFVAMAKKNIFCKKHGSYGNWGRINHFGKWLKDLKAGSMRRAKSTVGEFYTALFGTRPPRAVPACYAGCFSASRANLQRHPKTFYQKALSFVNDHSNPEEGHYFERLWAAIINMH
ncbi:uncharacterized protein LOC110975458 isoform X3 [Acanthaster planci]|uniref:Uncharacterized protein LOC110975458 isoform X3 n=1 Tax=Acanthaster planci TaxID=133434 RepID=A0A8B7XS36_ACAPL|nr:uncharacterized protein LOC110975458 isoform X3 [Acanthaster planci]